MNTKFGYRRNNWLNAGFIILTLVSLTVALILAHRLTEKFVENEFNIHKIDVLEGTLDSYNEFFHNKVPEISFYRGYLDSASAVEYADSVFRKYSFVDRIVFYHAQLGTGNSGKANAAGNLFISGRVSYQFTQGPDKKKIVTHRGESAEKNISTADNEEFDKMSDKLINYISTADTLSEQSSADYLSIFYNITHNRVTFMNIPLNEDVRRYKNLENKSKPDSIAYDYDIVSFMLNPAGLKVKNAHPELYEEVSVKPVMYEYLDSSPDIITTDMSLSGPFADYKLFFKSSESYLEGEIMHRLIPIVAIILLIYVTLVSLAYVIYRNLNINSRMFKLQYDFINNLTHEFKTPVSVIKIAGNNIRSALELSDYERRHYGKILDEEADKLNDLMNKLLSFTQIENHSIKVKKQNINLDVFVSNLVDAYSLKYPEFNIHYTISKIEYFSSDPVLMTSLFQNMMDNAYKYSSVDKKVIDITISTDKGMIIFKFKDAGIGIAPEEQKNVFKKFYRIQSQYNQQGSVGLGLAFCKELVTFLHGEISLKSKVGEGSEFTIKLPL